jgi:large conductance mechanosensitive channel
LSLLVRKTIEQTQTGEMVMSMMSEFRDFAIKGNALDLAVGVIIGGAFGKIVDSLVKDILMPIVGLFLGGVNFSGLALTVKEAVLKYGSFIQAIIDFVVIAFVLFMIIRAANKLKQEAPPAAPAAPPEDVTLLREIRDALKR